MTQEERRLKRQQDTKQAVMLLAGMGCVALLVIIMIVLAISFLLKNTDEPVTDTQVVVEMENETETESVIIETETEEAIIDPLTQEAISVVAKMTLEQKVAQMFIVTPDGLTGSNGATVVGNTTKSVYATYPVGGLIYENDNFQTKVTSGEGGRE